MAGFCVAKAVAVVAALVAVATSVQGHPGELPPLISLINVPATTFALDDSIAITVNATRVTNGQFVTVSWTGVSAPADTDWVGVYSPSTVDMASHFPIKFQFANHSMTHGTTGSGSLQFQLLNLRADYVFSFMRGGIKTPSVAAVSSTVTFADYNEPLQVHLALASKPGYMTVMWSTLDASNPVVELTHNGVTTDVAATTTTYTAADLCGAPATTLGWRSPGSLHSGTVGPLVAGETYTYRVGSRASGGLMSETFTFVAPPPTDPVSDVNIIAFGDLGRGEVDDSIDGEYWRWGNYQPSLWTTDSMIKGLDTFDLVLNIGDTSYADGVSSEWDEFFHQIAPIAESKPWMTCVGNHELDWPVEYSYFNSTDSGGECGIPQEKRFGMPNTEGPQSPWYSFDYGNVHVTLMSTEHDFMPGSPQHAWILKDLANMNRTRTPWAIFAGHRPFYVDSTWNSPPDGDGYVAGLLREAYEAALKEFNVNLGIMGHHHTYQRTCAVYKSQCVQQSDNGVYTNPGVPVYNVIGMAGAPFTTNFKPTRPSYMEFVDDQNHGFYRINTNLTTLHAQFVALDATLQETILDEFWIKIVPPPTA